MTRPNRDKNTNPLSLTWSLPDHTTALEVFCTAIIDLHAGDITTASRTTSTFLKNYDQDTSSVWITPNDWISFDFLRIFIRNYVRLNMRFETFPAHGILSTNTQPIRNNLFRYYNNTTLIHNTHNQFSQQVPHSQNCHTDGRLHYPATYTGIHLCQLGRRLNFYNAFPIQFHKRSFIFRTFVIHSRNSFFPGARRYLNRLSNINTFNCRNYVTPVVSRSNLVNRYKSNGPVPDDERRRPRTADPLGKLNLSTAKHRQTEININPLTPKGNPPSIHILEEDKSMHQRGEKLANTTTMHRKVKITNKNHTKTPSGSNYALLPTGPHPNISNPEEGTPKPPRAEKMASTTTSQPEVCLPPLTHVLQQTLKYILNSTFFPQDLTTTTKSTALPRCLGLHLNICNPEEGMPKPPRDEIMATTTTTKLEVSYSHSRLYVSKDHYTFHTNTNLPPAGPFNDHREVTTHKLARPGELDMKRHKARTYKKPKARHEKWEPQIPNKYQCLRISSPKLGGKKRGATKSTHFRAPPGRIITNDNPYASFYV